MYTLLDDDQAPATATQGAGGKYTLLEDAPASTAKPATIGKDANDRFLRDELKNADPFTRAIAGFGVGASDTWEGLKQLFGKGDRDRIEANKVIRDEAPAASIAGDVALMAGPMAAAGTSIKAAAGVGGAFGALRPTRAEGWEGLGERLKHGVVDAALSGVGQAATNAGGRYVARKMADNATRAAQNAPRDQVIADALDIGLVAPPTSVSPTRWNTLEESFGGKIATAQEAANRNAPKFEQAIRTDLAIPADVAVTPEVLAGVRDRAYQLGYKPIADLPEVLRTPEFLNGLKSLSPKGKGGAVRSPAQAEVDGLLGELANQNRWTGEQLVHDIRTLREQSRANYGAANRAGGDTVKSDLARVQAGAAEELEKLATQNVGDPTLVANLRAARRQIAKAHDAEDALIAGGGVNARSWVKNADLMDGAMGKAAKFAAQFPKASQTPQAIAGPGVSKLAATAATLLAGGGAAAGGPVGLLAGAAPLLVPPALRAHMLSGRAQKNVLRDLYKLPTTTRAGVNVLRALPYSPAALAQS